MDKIPKTLPRPCSNFFLISIFISKVILRPFVTIESATFASDARDQSLFLTEEKISIAGLATKVPPRLFILNSDIVLVLLRAINYNRSPI